LAPETNNPPANSEKFRNKKLTMEEKTLSSALSHLSSLGRWSSENLMVPVFPKANSDESVEVDLSVTMKGTIAIPRVRLIEACNELPFEVCPNRFTIFQNFTI
jgi:hypothetical protein